MKNMSEVDKEGWQRFGWVHINPDVKDRLKRLEANQKEIIELLRELPKPEVSKSKKPSKKG